MLRDNETLRAECRRLQAEIEALTQAATAAKLESERQAKEVLAKAEEDRAAAAKVAVQVTPAMSGTDDKTVTAASTPSNSNSSGTPKRKDETADMEAAHLSMLQLFSLKITIVGATQVCLILLNL
jgi:metal-dependent amidase/aminoacylase/carboxypeptidase family protein